ncbi:MAG: hypothetical protein CL609_17280 [Anaerolineaceae bacterium]|nr:hypothetical protein [Anaerolineaceae bacterium]
MTRGNLIGSNAILSYLRMEYSSYTAIVHPGKGEKPHVGQVRFNIGEQFARLSFFAPAEELDNRPLLALLDHLAWECGNRHALRLIAEIDEDDPCFEAFRQAGFMVYARQRIWKIPASQQDTRNNEDNPWVTLNAASQHALQNLYHVIVPPLVQGAEAMDKRPVHGLGYTQNGELMAFVEVIHGPLGVFLLPVVHPNLRQPALLLEKLINQLPALFGRPVYLAVREYQSWLNSAAESLHGEPSQQKVLMVKHLARQQRVGVTQTLRKVLENHGAEPSAPIIQHSKTKE